MTIAYDVDYRNLTAESYVQYYVRPMPILGIITVGYLVPEIAYAVASYFLYNGANNAFA